MNWEINLYKRGRLRKKLIFNDQKSITNFLKKNKRWKALKIKMI